MYCIHGIIHDVYRLFLVTLNFQYSVECSNVQVDILLLTKTIFKLNLIFFNAAFFFKGHIERFWPDHQPDLGWEPRASVQYDTGRGTGHSGSLHHQGRQCVCTFTKGLKYNIFFVRFANGNISIFLF